MVPFHFTRAVVAVPPIKDFYSTPHRFASLGGKIVADILDRQGVESTFVNFPVLSRRSLPIELPSALVHLRPFIIEGEFGRLSFFTRYQQFGPDIDECASLILGHQPDACFLSCFAFCYAEPLLELAALLKKRKPDLMIVAGGAGVSAYPGYFLRSQVIDYAISGEAEVSLPAFIRELRQERPEPARVPNLWRLQDGSPSAPSKSAWTTSQDLQLSYVKVFETKRSCRHLTVLSRGCPLKCRFCSNHVAHGDEFRTMPLDRLRAGLANQPVNDHESREIVIDIEDDNLLIDPDYSLAALREFRSRFPECSFTAENGIDYRLLTPELANALIDLGMRQFNLSLASIDPRALVSENRPADLRRYEDLLALFARRGIPTVSYFICGLQDDDRESIARHLAYLQRQPTLIGISLFYPVPGLPGFEDRSRFDALSPALCAGSSAWPWNAAIGTETLVTAFRLARFVNLSKEPAISAENRALLDRIRDEKKLYTRIMREGRREELPVPGMDEELVCLFFRNCSDHPGIFLPGSL